MWSGCKGIYKVCNPLSLLRAAQICGSSWKKRSVERNEQQELFGRQCCYLQRRNDCNAYVNSSQHYFWVHKSSISCQIQSENRLRSFRCEYWLDWLRFTVEDSQPTALQVPLSPPPFLIATIYWRIQNFLDNIEHIKKGSC